MKKIFLYIFFMILFFSCVSKKVYVDLQSKYHSLKKEKSELFAKYDSLLITSNKKQVDIENLKQKQYLLIREKTNEKDNLKKLQQAYDELQKSYHLLTNKSVGLLARTAKQNSRLLKEVFEKQDAISKESKRIEKMKTELDKNSKYLKKLKQLITKKENNINTLKKSISNALDFFEGVSVTQKKGRVYVSIENKLLFKAGSWQMDAEGKKTMISIAKILVQNPDIKILIEAHTNPDPYRANKTIENNQDLSLKRATVIVRLLQKNKINPKRLTLASRIAYAPLASNAVKYAKTKNTRIEIILSPNIDAIYKLLKNE